MAKSEKTKFIDKPIFRLILTICSLVIAAVILVFSALTIIEITNNTYDQAPKYLVWIFIAAGVMSIIMFLKERTKLNFIKCIVMLGFNVVLGVIVLFAKSNPFLFSLTAGLYCLNLILGCVFNMIQKRNVRSYIFNGLIIVFAIAMAIGMLVSPIAEESQIQNIILVECIFIAVVSFIEAASIAFSQLKVKVLFKIVLNTFSLEILFGLLTMIVCFSLVFMKVEDSITTFPEALWYCFAVVTTIGFGDFVAVTPIGRILTVFLGLYGIVVVAVITSIVVNFYNETSGKHDSKELKKISEEEEKKK
ncbi:MAG: two pore domain potassium channel family protein [Bacilli bacterium]|nr:two pore domain potassium channel family protein [Bacilli bacterium]